MKAVRMQGSRIIAILLLLGACGDGGTGPSREPVAITIESGNGGTATVGMATDVRPTVRVTDARGNGVVDVPVTFTVQDGGWVARGTVLTDESGRAATTWYLGPEPGANSLTARAVGLTAAFSAEADPLVPGQTYYAVNQYVQLIAGDLPIIISAPHGGTLTPTTIPDRDGANATTARDLHTDSLAVGFGDALEDLTGGRPHTIIMRLHRRKLDANREIGEAAESNPNAEHAWREYHSFIEAARAHVIGDHGRGFYIDLHGHSHPVQRVEVGYLLTAAELAASDAAINATATKQRSSIRTIGEESPLPFVDMLRGPTSVGTLLETAGFPAVPSASQPHPGAEPYFNGGYNTARHASRDGGPIDGVQLELNMTGLRDTPANRSAFADALADVITTWMEAHYGFVLAGASD